MSKLTLKLLTAKIQLRQCREEIEQLSPIIHSLKKMTALLDQPKIDLRSFIKEMRDFNDYIAEMKLRRGSIALQHSEIPWKQLIYLSNIIKKIEQDIINKPDLLHDIFKQKEVSMLKDKFEELLEEEHQKTIYLEQIINILEFQHEQLSSLNSHIGKVSTEYGIYKTVTNYLNALTNLNLDQQNQDNIKKADKIIVDLKAYVIKTLELPKNILTVLNPIFEFKFDTKQSASNHQQIIVKLRDDIQNRKNDLENAISILQEAKSAIENGAIKDSPDITHDANQIINELKSLNGKITTINYFYKIKELIKDNNFYSAIVHLNEKEPLRLIINNLRKNHAFIEKLKKINLDISAFSKGFDIDSFLKLINLINFEDFLTNLIDENIKDIKISHKHLQQFITEKSINYTYFFNTIDQNKLPKLKTILKQITNIDLLKLLSSQEQIHLKTPTTELDELIQKTESFSKTYNLAHAKQEKLNNIYDRLIAFTKLEEELLNTQESKTQTNKKTKEKKSPKKTHDEIIKEICQQVFKILDELFTMQPTNEELDKIKQIKAYLNKLEEIDSLKESLALTKHEIQKICNPLRYIEDYLTQLGTKIKNIKPPVTDFNILTNEIRNIKSLLNLFRIENPIFTEEINKLSTKIQQITSNDFNLIKQELQNSIRKIQLIIKPKSLSSNELLKHLQEMSELIINEQKNDKTSLAPNLITFINHELDLQNLEIMINCIERLESNTIYSISPTIFNRAFIKNLLIIGECCGDISYQGKQLNQNIPWHFFYKLRNIIYHFSMDTVTGRKNLNQFLEHASDKDQLITNCIKELSHLKSSLIVLKNNLEKKPYQSDIKTKKTLRIDPLTKQIKYFIKTTEKHIEKNILLNNFSELSEFLKSGQQRSEIDKKEKPQTIIADFIHEISQLKSLLEINITDNPLFNDARELTIIYTGELSRLLKDQSEIFSINAVDALLDALETLIILRGKFAHQTAIESIAIDKFTYLELIYNIKPLLELTNFVLDSFELQSQKILKKINSIDKKIHHIKNKIDKHPRYFEELKILELDKLNKLSCEKLFKYYETAKFFSDENNVKEFNRFKIQIDSDYKKLPLITINYLIFIEKLRINFNNMQNITSQVVLSQIKSSENSLMAISLSGTITLINSHFSNLIKIHFDKINTYNVEKETIETNIKNIDEILQKLEPNFTNNLPNIFNHESLQLMLKHYEAIRSVETFQNIIKNVLSNIKHQLDTIKSEKLTNFSEILKADINKIETIFVNLSDNEKSSFLQSLEFELVDIKSQFNQVKLNILKLRMKIIDLHLPTREIFNSHKISELHCENDFYHNYDNKLNNCEFMLYSWKMDTGLRVDKKIESTKANKKHVDGYLFDYYKVIKEKIELLEKIKNKLQYTLKAAAEPKDNISKPDNSESATLKSAAHTSFFQHDKQKLKNESNLEEETTNENNDNSIPSIKS